MFARKWVTFYDKEKKRVMIHKGKCHHLGSLGMDPREDDIRYQSFNTPEAAVRYARSMGVLVAVCQGCKPQVLRFLLRK